MLTLRPIICNNKVRIFVLSHITCYTINNAVCCYVVPTFRHNTVCPYFLFLLLHSYFTIQIYLYFIRNNFVGNNYPLTKYNIGINKLHRRVIYFTRITLLYINIEMVQMNDISLTAYPCGFYPRFLCEILLWFSMHICIDYIHIYIFFYCITKFKDKILYIENYSRNAPCALNALSAFLFISTYMSTAIL